MRDLELAQARSAAGQLATSFGLSVERSADLHNSNKLTLLLEPAGTVARVAPPSHLDGMVYEVELAAELVSAGCPVVGLDFRVPPGPHEIGGFAISFWTYHPTVAGPLSAAAYADALQRLHAGMRAVDVATPHVRDRVGSALDLLLDRELTPELPDEERRFLVDTLEQLGSRVDAYERPQLLHGEPHPGNLVNAPGGPVFVDLETCCRGPVEFDLAHAPVAVAEHYGGTDADLLRDCRALTHAMNITWRWDRDDQLPDGRRRGAEWLAELLQLLGQSSSGRAR